MEQPTIRSLQETARFFRVSVPTIKSWIDAGCPVHEKGGNGIAYKLVLEDVHRWRQDRVAGETAERQAKLEADRAKQLELLGPDMLPEDGEAMTPAQKRDTLAAEVAKVKLAEMRGRLVDAEAMRLLLVEVGTRLRNRLVALPDQLGRAHALTEPVVEAMTADVNRALTDLADELDQLLGLAELEDAA